MFRIRCIENPLFSRCRALPLFHALFPWCITLKSIAVDFLINKRNRTSYPIVKVPVSHIPTRSDAVHLNSASPTVYGMLIYSFQFGYLILLTSQSRRRQTPTSCTSRHALKLFDIHREIPYISMETTFKRQRNVTDK